ncbi:MAG: ATP-binding protein [Chloroflexi bacterium]|nr:ATP-binding protein [Chloroflexota bacterium]
MISNPYTDGDVVRDQNRFIGREEIIQSILDSLNYNQITALFGQRRVGKSSILHQIENKLDQSLTWVPIYIDLQGRLRQPLKKNVSFLVKIIRQKCKLEKLLSRELGSDFETEFSGDWIQKALNNLPSTSIDTESNVKYQKHDLVFLIDEFDDAHQAELPQNAIDFYNFLTRFLGKHPYIKVIVVLGRSPEQLSPVGILALNKCHPIRIPLMTKNEVFSLITLSEPHLSYSNDACEIIWGLTKGHPALTQSLCRKIWETYIIDDGSSVTTVHQKDVEAIKQTEGSDHIIQFAWDILDPQEQVLLCMLSSKGGLRKLDLWNIIEEEQLTDYYISADSIDKKKTDDDFFHVYYPYNEDYLGSILIRLIKSDWIELNGIIFHIKIPLFRDWVNLRFQVNFLIDRLVDKRKRANQLFLKASKLDDERESVKILEHAINVDSENDKILQEYIKLTKKIIEVCFEGENIDLALDYAKRLSPYASNLAKEYIKKGEKEKRKLLILRRISLLTDSDNLIDFIEAYSLSIRLESSSMVDKQVAIISLKLLVQIGLRLGTFLLVWMLDIVFWLPVLLITLSFRNGIINPATMSLRAQNSNGLWIILSGSILFAIGKYYFNNSTDFEDASWGNRMLWILFNISSVFFIIYPNLSVISNVTLRELVLLGIPAIMVILLILEVLDYFDGIKSRLTALILTVFTLWSCSDSGSIVFRGIILSWQEFFQGFMDIFGPLFKSRR